MAVVAMLEQGSALINPAELVVRDPCFGRSFSAHAKECRACIAPVIVAGPRLVLFRELCESVCAHGAAGEPSVGRLRRLSYGEMRARMEARAGAERSDVMAEIWKDLLADDDPKASGRIARDYLSRFVNYMRRVRRDTLQATGSSKKDATTQARWEYPTPPSLKELQAWHSKQ